MDVPETLHEFYEQFADEDACWRAVREMRWPRGFICPRCGSRESHRLRTRRLEQCRTCRYQASPTAGTIFHKSRTPLRTWLLAIFFVARHKKGISALQLQRDTGLGSYQTAWTMLHKIRSALAHRPASRLTGLVEADEAYVGGAASSGVRGRGAPNKTLVAGLVERRVHSAGSVRLGVVPRATRERAGPLRAWNGRCRSGDPAHGWLASVQPSRQGWDSASSQGAGAAGSRPGDPPVDPQGVLQPQDLVARNLPRREPEAHAPLPAGVHLSLRPERA